MAENESELTIRTGSKRLLSPGSSGADSTIYPPSSYPGQNKSLKLSPTSSPHSNGAGQITSPPSSPSQKKSSPMNSQSQNDGPDHDAIKMFVGQVPRSMDEAEIRKMFEAYGPVYQLNVLRDKATGQSKGCCFVTFYTRKAALEAQNELHNVKTMAGMQHPVQMKPADSEKPAEERKLFVGMLAKKSSENDVRMMFAPFGTIEECTVLREQSGQSRGCAFVTYTSRQCAQNAIKGMHHSQTMEGCRFPIVVKFADTQKEKEMKKMQQMQANMMGSGPTAAMRPGSGMNSMNPQYLSMLQQGSSGNMGGMGNMGNMGGGGGTGGNMGGMNAMQLQQILGAAAQAAAALQSNPGLAALLATASSMLNNNNSNSSPTSTPSSGTGSMANNTGDTNQVQNLQNLQGLAALAAMATNNPSNMTPSNSGASAMGTGMGGMQQQQQQQHSSGASGGQHNGMGTSNTGNGSQSSGMDTLSQAYSGIQQYAASFPGAFSSQNTQMQQTSQSGAGKQTEGPDGANLFIYHLPQEFSDQDLMQMFMPFGSVISAKIFIDKLTNLSKCFGFVSYDSAVAAQAAIQAMNGFQIGMKRLKVQLKRPKSDSKPY